MTSIIDFQVKKASPIRNDFYLVMLDILSSRFPLKYYNEDRFPPRPIKPKMSKPKIQEKECNMLREIRLIFQKHGTDYRIIINPLYDQIEFNGYDLKQLHKIFGEKNVYDFSGVNELTGDIRNYYDTSHYKPGTGEKILRQIYNG